MSDLPINELNEVAKSIRSLAIDAIDEANSGHPGLPLGCAEIGAYLYGYGLSHNPKNPEWRNRDRFILSAGHGSMLQYACLYLSGYNYTLQDIKDFRQLHSKTPGHPEVEEPGVETTTGPLGQGIAHGVGMALAQKITAAQCNAEQLLNHHVVVLCGDGCLMEGVSAETSSLAGHLSLGNLILFYDANDICLDGPIDECFTENVEARYRSYGWQVLKINGHDFNEIHDAYTTAKDSPVPTIIIARTTIGFGSPNRAGTSDAHGKALGADESKLTKVALGIPQDQPFWVSKEATAYMAAHGHKLADYDHKWEQVKDAWTQTHPEDSAKLDALEAREIPVDIDQIIERVAIPDGKASRASSQAIIQEIHHHLPFFIGGSADLSCSDSTWIKKDAFVSKSDFSPRNVKYGVREFGMAAMACGMSLYGSVLPLIGTFLTFSDYMKNAIRLAALMNVHVIYQFTHDSILLGEDGPTHQPVEHIAALRAMPNVVVIRPGDTEEVKGAWVSALKQDRPVALILSRQGLPAIQNTDIFGVHRGAYVVKKEATVGIIDHCILATGSELVLAVKVAEELTSKGLNVRVVSFPSFELFDEQTPQYQDEVLGQEVSQYWSIEAQTSFGWHKYIGRGGKSISVDTFGKSAPASDLAKEYGFTVEQIVDQVLAG
jgi:transketolase